MNFKKAVLAIFILLSSCSPSPEIKFFLDVSLLPKGEPKQVIKIGLLDSGISTEYLDWFKEDTFQNPNDFIDDDNDVSTTNLHGTLLSLLMCGAKDNMGLCQELKIIPVRIIDEVGITTPELVLKGLEYVKEQGCQIINMSLGSNKYSQDIADLINSFDESVLLFASVGDHNLDHYLFPASLERVYAVSAVDEEGILSSSSNIDSVKSTLRAPGKDLKISLKNGECTYKTGSSYATAIVSGLVGACMTYDCLMADNLKAYDVYDDNGKLSLKKLMNI